MNDQLMYLIAQIHAAELQQAGERTRLASEARATRRRWRGPTSGPSAQLVGQSTAGRTAFELEPTIASER